MKVSKVQVQGGVRQRGKQVARLATVVDAAFAFAMMMLVAARPGG